MPILIKRGARGADIADLQSSLNLAGPSAYPRLVADGIYGPNTARRVREFQELNGLKVDGIVGPNTWGKLQAALQPPTQAAPGKPRPSPPPSRGVLYLHAHDAPGKNVTFDCDRGKTVHHVVVPRKVTKSPLTMVTETLDKHNMIMSAMVINTHGGGAGTVKVGGTTVDLGPQAQGFRKLQPRFTPAAEMRIYACAFATAKVPEHELDGWIVNDGEQRLGKGVETMKALARATGCVVKAGFGMQFGTSGEFVGPWVKCSPSGAWSVNEGRELTAREKVGTWEAIAGSAVSVALSNLGRTCASGGCFVR